MARYFRHLNYTMGDEDASPEMELLPRGAAHVMAVADCGSRIIPLLARQPRRLSCVDISPPQLAVCELRLALLRACDLPTFKAFLGYEDGMPPARRQAVFQGLLLSQRARTLLVPMYEHIGWDALLYQGQFERMLRKISLVTRLLTGRAGRGIFETRNMAEQRAYYERHFPKWRWQWVLRLMGNSTALNSLLYRGDFPRKNIAGSHFSIYDAIFRQLLTEQPVRGSFFLQMVFLGRLQYAEGQLLECDPQVYAAAQRALHDCEVEYRCGDVFEAAAGAEGSIDFLSLSDVPSFLPAGQEQDFLQKVRSGLREDALVVVRAHLRRPHPALAGYADVSAGHAHLASRDTTRLWSFHLYKTA